MSPSKRDSRRARDLRAQRAFDAASGQTTGSQDPQDARRARARSRHRRTIAARMLFAAGFVVGLQHLGFHLAASPGALSDVLVGYPTAGALVVGGAMALPTSGADRQR